MHHVDPIRLLIVDDQELFLEGIASLLATCPELEVVGCARSGNEALALCQTADPQIVLLDLAMPERDGLEVLREMRGRFPALQVIMLTVHDDYTTIQECIQQGARGYVLKINGKIELLRAIQDVAGGRRYLDPKVMDTILDKMDAKTPPTPAGAIVVDGIAITLTRREQEILAQLAAGKTSEVIANELFISVNTVDTHRKNILSKLGAKNVVEAVRMAAEAGALGRV